MTTRIGMVAASLDIVGGQEVQAQALIEGLEADGKSVTFIPINPRFPRGLGWVRRYPYVRTILNQCFYVPRLARLRSVDVVHVFSAAYWSFVLAPLPAIVMARVLGKRVVLHYHTGEGADHLSRWGVLVHPWLRLAHEIVVPSEYLRAIFARHGYRVRVIRNVVDTARFRYRERVPLRPRLLSARNLDTYYRIDVSVEAFAILRARHPDATLVIAGRGPEEARLRRLAESLGDNGIQFVGRVEPRAMPALYDAADILVNSSVVDNQPVSILEAFSAGIPVVSTGVGDIGAMVRNGETGLLVPPGDAKALARGVAALLEDAELSHQIVQRARAEVAQYTWEAVRREWFSVYCG